MTLDVSKFGTVLMDLQCRNVLEKEVALEVSKGGIDFKFLHPLNML